MGIGPGEGALVSEYRIYPDGVLGVLQKLQSPSETLSTNASLFPGIAESLAAACDDQADLATAINAFVSAQLQQSGVAGNHLAAASLGAQEATTVYVNAGYEMADGVQAAQNEALSAASDGDFDYFLPEGE
ncbi:hypothetical protein C5B85_12645 [Pseudoclavibacter sp. AY1F1]|nr:hypothetical protein C5B85_12645 [Pseudoclavibacter sp. AY1F1]